MQTPHRNRQDGDIKQQLPYHDTTTLTTVLPCGPLRPVGPLSSVIFEKCYMDNQGEGFKIRLTLYINSARLLT